MLSRQDLDKIIDKMVKQYGDVETALLNLIADYLKQGDIDSVDEIYQWQAEHTANADELAATAVFIVEHFQNSNLKDTKAMLEASGQQISDDINAELSNLTSKHVKTHSSEIIHDNVTTVSQEIKTGMMNLINRNVASNALADIYKNITNQCVADVVNGGKTLERAIDDNIYQQVAKGIPTGLVNKRGAVLSLEGYSRLCIQTAVNRTFEDIRMNAMSDYGVTLGLYSIHLASRQACAPIQHQVINLVPRESPDYNDKYDSIYNHGYGEPGGCRGCNCKHYITPFVDGVSSVPDNPFPNLTPGQAVKNGKIQAKQRGYERAIRQAKKQLAMAKRLKDEQGIKHYQELIRNRQARLRQLVNDNDFLFRDYSREQARTTIKPNEYKRPTINSGAIRKRSQHIQDFKPVLKGEKEARDMYLEISQRKKQDVIKAFSKNGDISLDKAQQVYEHIFEKKHIMQIGKEPKYFTPDYSMANSFMRIINNTNIRECDKILLKHEWYESQLMSKFPLIYRDAHELTNLIYNYEEVLDKGRR